jgi:endoglucanase
MARWPTTDPGRVRTEVDNLVTAASHVNRVPMIVLDGLPGPRCAPERPGGLPDADTYRTWVTNLVAGISQRPAIVIVEPNSLRTLDCLAPSDQQARLALIRDAVSILIAKAYRGAVLLDGGDGRGVPPRVMAGRLHDADVGRVEGFAIGGGYTADGDARTYGAAVRDELVRLGDRRDYFYEAIDSSRNGNGSRDQPCNPAGAKLGAPTRLNGSATDGQTLWITNPGISDGDCGIAKGTTPGQFSPELAHRLIVGT